MPNEPKSFFCLDIIFQSIFVKAKQIELQMHCFFSYKKVLKAKYFYFLSLNLYLKPNFLHFLLSFYLQKQCLILLILVLGYFPSKTSRLEAFTRLALIN